MDHEETHCPKRHELGDHHSLAPDRDRYCRGGKPDLLRGRDPPSGAGMGSHAVRWEGRAFHGAMVANRFPGSSHCAVGDIL